jgi:hypothetical protein
MAEAKIEEGKEEVRTTTSWTEMVPSWGGRGQISDRAGGVEEVRERNTCKDGFPPDVPRMRRL